MADKLNKEKLNLITSLISATLLEKNKAYGGAISSVGECLNLLYPNGIMPKDYKNAGLIVRILDKLMRIANGNIGEESAFFDIAGYGILGCYDDIEVNNNMPKHDTCQRCNKKIGKNTINDEIKDGVYQLMSNVRNEVSEELNKNIAEIIDKIKLKIEDTYKKE